MVISYRMGKPDDAYQIARLLHIASGGLSDFLLHDILPNCEILDLIALGVTDKEATISFSKTFIAESNEEIIGIVNFYPAHEHTIPDIMKTFIPAARINHIMPFFEHMVPDSLYLHAVAVKEQIATKSVARSLILKVIDYAKQIDIPQLSAHVWRSNTRVLNVLLKGGFEVKKSILLDPHPLLPQCNEMLLLAYPIHLRTL